jgi:hypothetical protein
MYEIGVFVDPVARVFIFELLNTVVWHKGRSKVSID